MNVMNTAIKGKIEVRILSDVGMFRRPCLICGGMTSKDSVIAAVFEDGEQTDFVVCPGSVQPGIGYVKPGCLALSKDTMSARLQEHADRLRAEADEMSAIAKDLPEVPTRAAWQSAFDEHERAVADEIAAARSARPRSVPAMRLPAYRV